MQVHTCTMYMHMFVIHTCSFQFNFQEGLKTDQVVYVQVANSSTMYTYNTTVHMHYYNELITSHLTAHIGCFALGVPTVFSIVSHLISHVLPESQPSRTHSNTKKKQVDTTNVVA